jgi:hypothetical protein
MRKNHRGRIFRIVREQPVWTPTEMSARTNDLAKRALKVWPPLNAIDRQATTDVRFALLTGGKADIRADKSVAVEMPIRFRAA